MIPRPVFAFLLALLLPAGLAAQTPAPSPAAAPPPDAAAPTFPAEVEQVTVDVVVTDKKGVPATGLTAADFQIFEDDKPQKIASFDAVEVPATASATTPTRPRISTNTSAETRTGRSFVVVFDDIHLTPHQALRAKGAVAEFLRTGVREGDRVSLVATGGGAWWTTRMEAGRDELIAMLKRLDGRHIPDNAPDRMSDYEAMRIHVYRDQQTEMVVARRFETFGASHRSGQRGGRALRRRRSLRPGARLGDLFPVRLPQPDHPAGAAAGPPVAGRQQGAEVGDPRLRGVHLRPQPRRVQGRDHGLAPVQRGHLLPRHQGARGVDALLHRRVRPQHRQRRPRGGFPRPDAGGGGRGVPGHRQRRLHRQEHQRPGAGDRPHRRRIAQLLPRSGTTRRTRGATAASGRSR